MMRDRNLAGIELFEAQVCTRGAALMIRHATSRAGAP
jgi:hypothetical protein